MKDVIIHTLYDPPPIPLRTSDWCAWVDDMDQGVLSGFGSTQWDAIADLADQMAGRE